MVRIKFSTDKDRIKGNYLPATNTVVQRLKGQIFEIPEQDLRLLDENNIPYIIEFRIPSYPRRETLVGRSQIQSARRPDGDSLPGNGIKMKTHKIRVVSLTTIASRRERAMPLAEKLKAEAREYELIELDFTSFETVGTPFFDQIATSSAAEGKLDRIVFVIREDYIQNLKFVSKHRRLAIRYRLENEAEIKKIEEPPPLQEPEPTRADIEELPPSPYDPNPKEIF